QRDFARLDALLRRAQTTSRYAQDPLLAGISAIYVADIAFERGDERAALGQARQALTITFDLKHTLGMIGSLSTLADLARRRHPERAVRLLAAADAAREEAGFSLVALGENELGDIWNALRSQLPPVDFAKAEAEGRALSLESAYGEAIDLLAVMEY